MVICDELSEGKPLRQICREKGIAWKSIYNWSGAYQDFAKRLAVARDMGEDAIAAEILDIADNPLTGEEVTVKGDGTKEIRRGDMFGHRKLQIDARFKLLAKWNPKKWGDKTETTHKGDPGAPVQLVLRGSDVHG